MACPPWTSVEPTSPGPDGPRLSTWTLSTTRASTTKRSLSARASARHSLPGSAGNSVLSGHRTTHTHPFEDLDRLKEGDLIETNNGTDAGTQFQVVSIETVAESEYVDYALAAPESPESVSLTLFACTPKGSKSHRIVVRAAAVAPIDGRGGA